MTFIDTDVIRVLEETLPEQYVVVGRVAGR
jgi:hypothetical protein